MKYLKLVLVVLLFAACDTEESLKSDIAILKTQRAAYKEDVKLLVKEKESKEKEIQSLNQTLRELGIYMGGDSPKYLVKIKCKQSRLSLDFNKHFKDSLNSFDFELPVSKEFYQHISVGDNIADNFRAGSFLVNGTFSNWNMTIINKRINE